MAEATTPLEDRIGVQLYTVRAEMQRAPRETLHAVSGLGYRNVEVAGFPFVATELRDWLDAAGLAAVSMHVPLDRLRDAADEVAAEARTLGMREVVCPWVAPAARSEAGWRQVAADLAAAVRYFAGQGIQVSYHNHNFEFGADAPGGDAVAYLLREVPGLAAQLDVYWLERGGQDPVAYLERHAGATRMLHLKDVNPRDGSFAEVGAGTLDMTAILRAADAAGVRWLIVEQDTCPGNPLDSLRESRANLTRLLSGL